MPWEGIAQTVTAMPEMARQMGNGDPVAGMVRMMEITSMTGQAGGRMAPAHGRSSQ